MLSKTQIFAHTDLPVEDVDVPEWGGTVRIRTISGTERDRYEASLIVGKGKGRQVNLVNARAKLIRLCAVDAEGKPLFDDTDELALGRLSSKALDRLFEAAQRLNGLSDDSVDEAEKNCERTPDCSSTSS